MTEHTHNSLVISLDGATWKVLRPLIQEGYLPTVEKLASDGITSPLRSVVPPITAAAWTSFHTGVSPSKHGVSTFNHITDGGRDRTTVDATVPDYPSLWEYLETDQVKTISVNVPGTFPATGPPSKSVSGVLAPSFDHEDAVHPPELRDLVDDIEPEYTILDNPRDTIDPHTSVEEYVDVMISNARSRSRVTRGLMQRFDWDVTMMHIQSTDVLQHPLWKHLDPDHPGYQESKWRTTVRFYEVIDTIIEEVVDLARSGTSSLDIYLISDHGFQGLQTELYIDRILEEAGLIVRATRSWKEMLVSQALSLGLRADVLELRKHFIGEDQRSSLGHRINTGSVDWEKSVAWGHGNMYGYVYLLDGSKKETVISTLESQIDTTLIADIIDVNEEYSNVHSEAPDLIVVPESGVSIETANDTAQPCSEQVDYTSAFHVGGHAMDGIFLLNSTEDVRDPSDKPNLVDILPTILYRHGVGIPRGLDGVPLVDIFADPREPETVEPRGVTQSTSETGVRESVEERLQDLGYTE